MFNRVVSRIPQEEASAHGGPQGDNPCSKQSVQEGPDMHRIVVPVRHRGRAPYRAALMVLTLFLAVTLIFGGDGALVASAAARPKDDPARTSRDKEDSETEREDDPVSTGRDNGGQQTESERDPAAVEDEAASKQGTKRQDDSEAKARDRGGVEAQAVKVFSNSTPIRGRAQARGRATHTRPRSRSAVSKRPSPTSTSRCAISPTPSPTTSMCCWLDRKARPRSSCPTWVAAAVAPM